MVDCIPNQILSLHSLFVILGHFIFSVFMLSVFMLRDTKVLLIFATKLTIMIQRIQSVYLLLATVLMLLLTIMPVSELLTHGGEVYHLAYRGVYMVSGHKATIYSLTLPLTIGISIASILGLIDIFFYKKRALQMKLSLVTILFMAIVAMLEIYYTFSFKTTLDANIALKVAALFPFISIILVLLAYVGIKKDDELVRSADRIR
jgi:hypothetical protein